MDFFIGKLDLVGSVGDGNHNLIFSHEFIYFDLIINIRLLELWSIHKHHILQHLSFTVHYIFEWHQLLLLCFIHLKYLNVDEIIMQLGALHIFRKFLNHTFELRKEIVAHVPNRIVLLVNNQDGFIQIIVNTFKLIDKCNFFDNNVY